MDAKTKIPHLDTLRKILSEQNGLILTSDLAEFNIPRTYLSIMERNMEIERVSRGVYRSPTTLEDEMFSLQSRYKSCIYSHETALFLHDLTDRNPLAFSISVPSGYHSSVLNGSGHKIFYVERDLFELGLITMPSPHGNEIRVTDLERPICDILRSRNQIEFQFIAAALKRYVTRKEKNIHTLYNYAQAFQIQKIVRQHIEVLL